MGTWVFLAAVFCALPAGSIQAQQDNRPIAERVISAVKIETAPHVDGNMLGDPVWERVPPASGFIQTTPDEGRPASQRTDVRVAYTDETLFFGIMCFDNDPASIIISDSRRDADLEETDSIRIILDTYLDEQNGFVFGTNPAGIEYDGQVTKEGAGGGPLSGARQSAGSGGGFNINWDGVWEVRTQIDDEGWGAEFAIPFKTLRYSDREIQSWGVNFQRNIRRRNETAYWAPLSLQFNLFRLVDAGRLEDLQIPSQRNLVAMPYGLGETRQKGDSTGTLGDVGMDLKYSITPALTLDLTYNTDFAQVEVDEFQVNLNRFNLFFPEKRPFFLENAGLFAVGNPGLVELFFSRRIGISEDGDVIPILAGARLSGRIASTSIGFLNMQTEELENTVPANNFTVGRVNREFRNRSSVGAVFVNRQATGNLARPDDYNRTFGVDGRWGIGRYGLISGFAARTSTPGLEGDDHAYAVTARYDSPAWAMRFDYTEVADDFNPEVGFLRREGYRRPMFRILRRYRLENNRFGLHELRPHISYSSFWNFEGFQETGFVHIGNHTEWKSGAQLQTAVNLTHEGVTEPFEISDGVIVPPGTYKHTELNLVGISNQGAWLSFNVETFIGGYFGGDRITVLPSVRMRIGERFVSELNWAHNDIELPGGNFVTDVGGLRLSYAFTPNITVQTLFQYNNVDEIWSTNLRFSWLQAANTGLFVVYNDTRGFGNFSGEAPDRSLIIKYSRLFDLLR